MFFTAPSITRKLREELYETEIALADQRCVCEQAGLAATNAALAQSGHTAHRDMLAARVERMRADLREAEMHEQAVKALP